MKKRFFALNLLLIAATLISGFCYYQFGGITLKGFASSLFALTGLVNLIYAIRAKVKPAFPILMLTGLFLCMVGDIVLNIEFIYGALIFAIGHLFYVAAYCRLAPLTARDLLPIAVMAVFTVLLITVSPLFHFSSPLLEGVCVLYGVIISCMVGKAVSNFLRERSATNTVLIIGSCLFYFSDLMLALNAFADAPHICDTLCLASYYPAQCLLAYAVFQFVNKGEPS